MSSLQSLGGITYIFDSGDVLFNLSTYPTFTEIGSSIMPEHSSVPIAIAQIFFTATGLCFTVMIFITFLVSPKLRTAQNVFIMNLAVADFLLLCASLPPVIVILSGRGHDAYGGVLCDLYALLIILNAFASISFMGAIGFTRFISICYPHYKVYLFTWRRCITLAIVIWLYNVGIVIPALTGWGRFTYHEKMYLCGFDFSYNQAYNIVIITGTYGIVFCVVFVCYLQIYREFRKNKRNINKHIRNNGSRPIRKDEIRLAVQLLVIFVIYNVCWGPIMMLLFIIDPHGRADTRVYEFALFVMYINSIVNGPLYLYFNRLFRSEVFRIWFQSQKPIPVPSTDNDIDNDNAMEMTTGSKLRTELT